MAGASAERQENGFKKAVDDAVRKNKRNPIIIDAGGVRIKNVDGAKKFNGRQSSGSEPYTDIVVSCKNKKPVNLSLKGTAAPSLAGGGLRGIEAIVPGLGVRFMKAALKKLLEMGLKKGDKVPDVYGKVGLKIKEKIVVGTPAMGGPIDYMYIGPMDVKGDFRDGVLYLNGKLTESIEYAKTHDLYFRLRARRKDQTFDPDAEQGGTPKIYGVSPSSGDSAGRIVVTDSVPKNAVIVEVR